MNLHGLAIIMLIALTGVSCSSPKSSFRFQGDVVVVQAVDGNLIVRPKGGKPLLGRVDKANGRIQFTPQFPLLTGETYEAIFSDSNGQQTILEHTIAINSPAPRVKAIYPSTGRLPANHLKFYLHFTEPMQQNEIFGHFKLTDLTSGLPVEEPFRETELWSADGKRLTLWLHPGRQKTGVNLNVDLGPILMPNRRYALEISSQWKSQAGVALKQSARKQFATTAADRIQPDIRHWKITVPRSHSRMALKLTFPKPLDSALIQNLITIEDANGRYISGGVQVSKNETQWSFTPTSQWTAGDFRVRVDWELEDLAGNNLLRLFEMDVAHADVPVFAGPRYLRFHLK
jgi:hypothetical protein